MSPAIFVVLLVASSSDQAATDKAAQAYAAQERVGEHLDAYYRLSFSEDNRHRLGVLASATQMISERKIVLRWEFP